MHRSDSLVSDRESANEPINTCRIRELHTMKSYFELTVSGKLGLRRFS